MSYLLPSPVGRGGSCFALFCFAVSHFGRFHVCFFYYLFGKSIFRRAEDGHIYEEVLHVNLLLMGRNRKEPQKRRKI
jgi:hypothetical protein